MKFTESNSILEILDKARPEFQLFFPRMMLNCLPEAAQSAPLASLRTVLMPWGLPFPVAQVLSDANTMEHPENVWKVHPLWAKDGFTPETNDLHSVALMEILEPSDLATASRSSAENAGKGRPAVIICPGGGYENLSFHNEGLEIAWRMQKEGYKTFVLSYRVSPNRYPAPQLDLAEAIRYVRAHASGFGIDPGNVCILGFSAGGHLCASTAALRDELARELDAMDPALSGIPVRPDKVCLCYPVISFLSEAHEGSFQCLTGGDESLRGSLSIETQVDGDYPKTFVWTCADDSLVPPSNAERMAKALRDQGVDHKLRIYPTGEHGCSLGKGTSAEGWMDEMLAFFR